jgi:hypothetical protein
MVGVDLLIYWESELDFQSVAHLGDVLGEARSLVMRLLDRLVGKEHRTPVSHNRSRSLRDPSIFTPNISRGRRRHPLRRLMHILFALRPLALSARFLCGARSFCLTSASNAPSFGTPYL